MPTWGATIWGLAASAVLAALLTRFALRERRVRVIGIGAVAAILGSLAWDLILRHTGGNFFVDAPGYVFPISFEDTGSGVFSTAVASLLLGLGPMRADAGRRLALTALACGVGALLVDMYLY